MKVGHLDSWRRETWRRILVTDVTSNPHLLIEVMREGIARMVEIPATDLQTLAREIQEADDDLQHRPWND